MSPEEAAQIILKDDPLIPCPECKGEGYYGKLYPTERRGFERVCRRCAQLGYVLKMKHIYALCVLGIERTPDGFLLEVDSMEEVDEFLRKPG